MIALKILLPLKNHVIRRSTSEHSFQKKQQSSLFMQKRLEQFSQNNNEESRIPTDLGTYFGKPTSPLATERQSANEKVSNSERQL